MSDEGIIPFLTYSWCLIDVGCFHLPLFASVLKLSPWSVAVAVLLEDSLNVRGLSSLSPSPWSCCWWLYVPPLALPSCQPRCFCHVWNAVPLAGLHGPASSAPTPSHSSRFQIQELGHARQLGVSVSTLSPRLCVPLLLPLGPPLPHTRPQGTILIPLLPHVGRES